VFSRLKKCSEQTPYTGWRRLIWCRKLQVIRRKRATDYRALLRKMTYEDKASHDSMPPCISGWDCCLIKTMIKLARCVFLSLPLSLFHRAMIASYQTRPSFSTSRKETRRISRRSVAWLAAPRHQRLGEHQWHTMWRTRHRKDTVRDHPVKRACEQTRDKFTSLLIVFQMHENELE